MSKQQIYKIIVTVTTAIVTCVAIALGLSSRRNSKIVGSPTGANEVHPMGKA